MTDGILITLTNGQTGYDVVAHYIENYWKHNGDFCDTVVVQFDISYNGKDFSTEYDVAYPEALDISESLTQREEYTRNERGFFIKTNPPSLTLGGE